MHKISGSCQCGNIELKGTVRDNCIELTPRVCECTFCRQNDVIYLSDDQGIIEIKYKNKQQVKIHKQGSRSANFIICKHCDSFIGVTYESDNETFASINLNMLTQVPALPSPQASIPREEAIDNKIKRWQKTWFKSVKIDSTN